MCNNICVKLLEDKIFIENILGNLTLKDLVNIVNTLEEIFHIKDLDNNSVLDVKTSSNKKEDNVSKEFIVQINTIPEEKKISLLKFVKNYLNIGLKDSKTFIDSLPNIIKKTTSNEEALALKKDLEGLGASVEIK